MLKKFKFLLFVPIISFHTSAIAEPYFKSNTISPTLIEKPFAVNSPEWKSEIGQIIKLQKSAKPAEVEKALSERDLTPDILALNVNPNLKREDHPALYKLLDRTADTSKAVTDDAKNFWNTKRPYLVDSKIKALIPAHDNPAYPSGHTSGSYVNAYVLSILMPDDREKFMSGAEKIAQHRVLVGMHFPHDLVGGKQLALLIVGSLVQNDEFNDDLDAAKKELASNK